MDDVKPCGEIGSDDSTAMLDSLGGASRKIAICIQNSSQYIFEGPQYYIASGDEPRKPPPTRIETNKGFIWGLTSNKVGDPIRGVLVYKIKGERKVLAFLWKVTAYQNEYQNSWAINVLDMFRDPTPDNIINTSFNLSSIS
ncbi:9783_t:CDS:2 [Racocetra persica]|uniref:9783_t:CDS:1 n=1 Tax=Racocetra persica TaxID=160502 RepID=A0ACA9PW99_9GLOM|nr:9783_t:CDS:2 [Racocetra persica]